MTTCACGAELPGGFVYTLVESDDVTAGVKWEPQCFECAKAAIVNVYDGDNPAYLQHYHNYAISC